jgi:hypothetical protein
LAKADPNRWREVALLAGAKSAGDSDFALWALVEELCRYTIAPGEVQAEPDAWGALLAGQMLVENVDPAQVSERDQGKMARVVGHLVQILEQGRLPALERAAAGVVLAKLGDPRPGVGVNGDGLPDIAWCEVPAGAFYFDEMFVRLPPQGPLPPRLPQRRLRVSGCVRCSPYFWLLIPLASGALSSEGGVGGAFPPRFPDRVTQSIWFSEDCRWNVAAKSLSRSSGAAIAPNARYGSRGYVQIPNLL